VLAAGWLGYFPRELKDVAVLCAACSTSIGLSRRMAAALSCSLWRINANGTGAQRRSLRRLQVTYWACGDDHSCLELALLRHLRAVLLVPRVAPHVRLLHLLMGFIVHIAASRGWRWQSAEAPNCSSCEQRDTDLIIGRDFCTIR